MEMESNDDSCVLFYKRQGSILEGNSNLKIEDFVLIIMNNAQKEILQKYGCDCICMDGTHGMNGYDFELVTLLVIDDVRQGFPCAFLISNRTDQAVLSLFLSCIKARSGMLKPKVFMSDMAESIYNAWIREMEEPKNRLYCSWHVDRAWRKNLRKIKNNEKQIEVYKILRTLLEETDPAAFTKMLAEAMEKFHNDPDTTDFAAYFSSQYIKNANLWAYCYRLHCGLNTNMHIERMHRTLKYVYLHGKNVKRLDKSIHAIMKFVRDRLFDRLLVMHKGKLTTKLQKLEKDAN
ncbi:uncharacterized protein LOC118188975 [Stegodyphus dumicola]|uniref:uncharacterized protein LOC118188975 n=1 Tax=Stegodyphus dumicola TaxID=202533 RepID=UPI0015AFE1CD|nr:uncharacterized protein LOC118188975 [Stegodyphus dumicola]